MRCPNCANDIEESLFSSAITFCPYCGHPLPADGHDQDKDMVAFCPYCGQELTAPTKFCPHCGQKLPGHDAAAAEKQGGEGLPGHDAAAAGKQAVEELVGRIAGAIKSTFGPQRKQKRLYRQWTEHSGLSSEEVPTLIQTAMDTRPEEEKDKRRFPALYLALAAAVLILTIGAILLVQTC